MEFIDLKAQYRAIETDVNTRIQRVLQHGCFIMGPEVAELEERLANYVGSKHCISCANGTDALVLSLMGLGIGQGDLVFCPTFTYFATAEAVATVGATPVFVDCEERGFNICPIDLEKRIVSALRQGSTVRMAVIAVDLFGLPADYPSLSLIAKEYGVAVIEDAAQGFGGAIGAKKAGSFGDIATTSFFPAKPLGCYGDGGAVFTDDDNLAEIIRSLRIHGKGKDKYDNVRIGMNSRLDTLQAAILLAKLDIFDVELDSRNRAAAQYTRRYRGEFGTPSVPKFFYSSWAQYTIITEDRESAIKKFSAEKIPTAVYYSRCLHLQTAFKYLKYETGEFPIAERLSETVLSLPMHGYL